MDINYKITPGLFKGSYERAGLLVVGFMQERSNSGISMGC